MRPERLGIASVFPPRTATAGHALWSPWPGTQPSVQATPPIPHCASLDGERRRVMAQQRGAVDGSPGVLSFLKRPRRFAWGSFFISRAAPLPDGPGCAWIGKRPQARRLIHPEKRPPADAEQRRAACRQLLGASGLERRQRTPPSIGQRRSRAARPPSTECSAPPRHLGA
jgi:hypothetical protein